VDRHLAQKWRFDFCELDGNAFTARSPPEPAANAVGNQERGAERQERAGDEHDCEEGDETFAKRHQDGRRIA